MTKKYFVTTNAFNALVITACDDEKTAVYFDVATREDAESLDVSNVYDMTADTMRNEYPDRVFTFDQDSTEFETAEPLPVLWYAVQADSSDDWGAGSFDREKAVAMAEKWNYKLIAVVEMGADPVCIDEIRL